MQKYLLWICVAVFYLVFYAAECGRETLATDHVQYIARSARSRHRSIARHRNHPRRSRMSSDIYIFLV